MWNEELRRAAVLMLVATISFQAPVEVVLAAGLAVTGVHSYLRYRNFRYAISKDALELSGGVLFRWRRVIPLSHIQSVDFVRKIRHRMWGVVELRVEAVGGATTEAVLQALETNDADRIRRLLVPTPQSLQSGASDLLVKVGPRQLVVAGITGGQLALVAVFLGALAEVVGENVIERLFDRAIDEIIARGPGGIMLVAGALFVLAVSAMAVSVIATLMFFWNFTVQREGNRLQVTRGLLDQRRALVPLARIQGVKIIENPVRRLFKLGSVSVILAGFAEPDQEAQETSLLLPVGSRQSCLQVASAILQSHPAGGDPANTRAGFALDRVLNGVRRPPLAALLKKLSFPAAAAMVIGLSAAWVPQLHGYYLLPVVLLAAAGRWLSWKSLGFDIQSNHAIVRSGVLARRTFVIPVSKLQHINLTAGPLQRKFRLASLHFGVAGTKQAIKAKDRDHRQLLQEFANLAGSSVA